MYPEDCPHMPPLDIKPPSSPSRDPSSQELDEAAPPLDIKPPSSRCSYSYYCRSSCKTQVATAQAVGASKTLCNFTSTPILRTCVCKNISKLELKILD
jgi:hypothetical protein